jgi:hypothetical protein
MRWIWLRHVLGGIFGIMVLVLAACGAPATVGHPTGVADVLVQLTYIGGGMSPSRLDYLTWRFPQFSLRGDGTLLYGKDGTIYQGRLDEAAIQRLLALAVNDVRFGDLPDFVGPQCCDMPGTSLSVNTTDLHKTITMSIMDDKSDSNSPEARLRRLLAALDALSTGQDPVYQPAGVTLFAESTPNVPAGTTAPAWPISSAVLAQVAQTTLTNGAGQHLTGPDAQQAVRLIHGTTTFMENGILYRVLLVPDAP